MPIEVIRGRLALAESGVPGFVDIHVHGWCNHDATGDAVALVARACPLAPPPGNASSRAGFATRIRSVASAPSRPRSRGTSARIR